MSINRVVVTGNLARDCELRRTQGGTAVASFSVGVNDRWKNQQTGKWEDRANWVDCNLFGNRAEALSRHLVKGTKVAVEGRLRWSSWEDRQTGQKRSKLDVTVDELEFLSRREGGQGAAWHVGTRGSGNGGTGGYGASDAYEDDDIPF